MTTIKVKANLLNALAKVAKENINKILKQLTEKGDFLSSSSRHIAAQNDVIFKFLRFTEDLAKYSDEEVDKHINVSIDEWMIITGWSKEQASK